MGVVYEEMKDGMVFMLPEIALSPEDQNGLAKIVRELRLQHIAVKTKFSRIYSEGGRGTSVMTSARIGKSDIPRAKQYCHLS